MLVLCHFNLIHVLEKHCFFVFFSENIHFLEILPDNLRRTELEEANILDMIFARKWQVLFILGAQFLLMHPIQKRGV